MRPLMVEIIAYAPTQYFHCQHCELVWKGADVEGVKAFHLDAQETSLPPEMMAEYRSLSHWVLQTVGRYGGRVVFKVIDAASIEGLLKSLRYGARRYPAFVIAGKEKLISTDLRQVEALIERYLALQPA